MESEGSSKLNFKLPRSLAFTDLRLKTIESFVSPLKETNVFLEKLIGYTKYLTQHLLL